MPVREQQAAERIGGQLAAKGDRAGVAALAVEQPGLALGGGLPTASIDEVLRRQCDEELGPGDVGARVGQSPLVVVPRGADGA